MPLHNLDFSENRCAHIHQDLFQEKLVFLLALALFSLLRCTVLEFFGIFDLWRCLLGNIYSFPAQMSYMCPELIDQSAGLFDNIQ